MAGVEYNVAAILSGKDQGLETKLHAAGKAADKAARSLEAAKGVATAAAGAIGKAGDIVGGAIDGLVSFAAKGVSTLGAAGIGAAMLGWYSGPEWHALSLPFPPARAVFPACLGAAWGGALAAWVVG